MIFVFFFFLLFFSLKNHFIFARVLRASKRTVLSDSCTISVLSDSRSKITRVRSAFFAIYQMPPTIARSVAPISFIISTISDHSTSSSGVVATEYSSVSEDSLTVIAKSVSLSQTSAGLESHPLMMESSPRVSVLMTGLFVVLLLHLGRYQFI